MAEFRMPSLGADMSAGQLVGWRKVVGDLVRKGEILAEVETDKGTVEVECFVTGVLEKILVEEGETVPVGTPLAIITPSDQDLPSPGEKDFEPSRSRASPLARRRAFELGVDLGSVHGTGPGGAVTDADVAAAASSAKRATAPAPEPEGNRQVRMRQAIAAAMARSKREIPHYYLSTTVDLGRALAWLAQENLNRPVWERLLPVVLLLKAVALALREVPELNGLWVNGEATRSEAIHLGVATSLRQGGLVAPALFHADQQTLSELMTNLRELVGRARAGTLRSSELSDPTITVTSLGDLGVEAVFGVIYPPQVAIVGFGRIGERPWAMGGELAVRPLVTATLSADHRVTDGHRGGVFLSAVDRILQEPERL